MVDEENHQKIEVNQTAIPEADVQRLLLHTASALTFYRRRRRLSARLFPPFPLFFAAVEDPANQHNSIILSSLRSLNIEPLVCNVPMC